MFSDNVDKVTNPQLQKYLRVMERTPRAGVIDTSETISLISLAKGSRSMSSFSQEIDENISKLSRIMSGKTVKLSNYTIAKIVAAALPENNVTLEKLMKAQGFSEIEPARTAGKKYTDCCRKIIVDSLLKKEYQISYMPVSIHEKCDFKIVVNGPLNGDVWKFDCVLCDSYRTCNLSNLEIKLRLIMSDFYLGEKCGRYSLVLADESTFEKMKKKISEYRIPDEISLIMISLESEEIKEEFIIPRNDNKEAVSFFSRECVDRLP